MAANRGPLLTTDYVLDETLTLMRSKGQRDVAIEYGEYIFNGLAGLMFLSRQEINAAWDVIASGNLQRSWSYLDRSEEFADGNARRPL